MQEFKQETFEAGVKVAPAVGGYTLYTLTLNEWVAVATLVYIALQIGLLVPKYAKILKRIKDAEGDH